MDDQDSLHEEYNRYIQQIGSATQSSGSVGRDVPKPPPPPPPPPQQHHWSRGNAYPYMYPYSYMPYPYMPHPPYGLGSRSASATSTSGSVCDVEQEDAEADKDQDLEDSDSEKKGIDLEDPSCKFLKVCNKKKKSHPVSDFVLMHWRDLKGFKEDGLFDCDRFPKENAWKKFKPVSALVDYHGNSLPFNPPTPEAELVPLGSSGYSTDAEKEWKVLQKHVGAVSHLLLQAQEGFESNYRQIRDLFDALPVDFMRPENQQFKATFDEICEKSIKEVSGQIGRAARIGSALHTDITDKRRKLYVKQMKKSYSSTLADQLEKFPPSMTHLFSNRVSELEKSVHLELMSKMAGNSRATRYPTPYKSSFKRKNDFRDSSSSKKKMYSSSKQNKFARTGSARPASSTASGTN